MCVDDFGVSAIVTDKKINSLLFSLCAEYEEEAR